MLAFGEVRALAAELIPHVLVALGLIDRRALAEGVYALVSDNSLSFAVLKTAPCSRSRVEAAYGILP